MSTPNNQNPYDPEGSSSGLPSYNDYSQGAGENYNQAYNDGYGQPNGAGFEQFPAGASQYFIGGGYAGVGKRVGALVIDYVILAVVYVAITLMFSSQLNDIAEWMSSSDAAEDNMPSLGALFAVAFLPPLLWLIYKVAMESWRGQTLGKMAVGIKVVDADGNLVAAGSSLIRSSWFIVGFLLMLFVPNFGPLAFIVIQIILGVLIARNPYDQHTCDTWAKTYVINSR